MKLIATADIHFNHPRSQALAGPLIQQINRTEADVLLLVGDTAAADGPALEQCLSMFTFAGPKLFVAGNHELWTHGPDSHALLIDELPRRVRNAGWQWLQTEPFIHEDAAIVGSVGWYDYSMVSAHLGIPLRFYEHKVSPGAAIRLGDMAPLLEGDDIPDSAREVVARWNDGKNVHLHRTDQQFCRELLDLLASQLAAIEPDRRIIAAIHHLPFAELLPPQASAQWEFAKAYLGSTAFGQLLKQYDNCTHLLCGHSHLPGQQMARHIHAINIGSGYRQKMYVQMEIHPEGVIWQRQEIAS